MKFHENLSSRNRVVRCRRTEGQKDRHDEFYCFTVHFVHLVFSPTYALIYIIKILSQAVILVARFTPTCFDPYGSSSGSTVGTC